ncbi:MAG: DNA cytosine methyltransferase [Aphanocapsa feldmannii 277cI]|uniref:Cytosine-specific methyltransferase n=1 Tax=Aphanocapsa feldmannii 277cI TaxID=2507554 RepID=A0A524RWD2_9CHRO|nr:MAG: DNA cytosine methyltransferase [Aphanocapsa feldmannii 277cI]
MGTSPPCTTIIPADPHRLRALRGPEQRLDAHPQACGLEDLPAHVRGLDNPGPLAVDLFCGAGGMSLGLHAAGFEVILGVDIRPDSIATHRHHFPGCSHQGDLSDPEELERIIRQLDRCGDISLVAGGPPCQPFSRNIRWRKHDEKAARQHRELNSGRRELSESFMTVVKCIRPRAFLMENVPDIALTGDQDIFRDIVSRAEAAGYRVHARIIYAWHHGVPQLRPRLFIAGTHIRHASPLLWPEPEFVDEKSAPNLLDAIGDLPPLQGSWREHWQEKHDYRGPSTPYQRRMREWLPVEADAIHDHITRRVREDDLRTFQLMRSTGMKYHQLEDDQRRYQVVSRAQRQGHGGKQSGKDHSFRNKYNILEPGQPCLTITAHMAKDGYWYIHPYQDRTLSIREAARVQSFPDGFRFHGTPSNRFHQVGEAVAPLVGEVLGRALLKSLQEKDKDNDSNWLAPQEVRDELLRWYRFRGNSSRLPWAAQRQNGAKIPEKVRAWRAFLGELIVSGMKTHNQPQFWPQIVDRWKDHEAYLQDRNRKMYLKALRSRKNDFLSSRQLADLDELLQEIADRINEGLPWSEWVRTDFPGFSRDRIRQCLAMVGITADRSCSIGLGRMVCRVMGVPDLSVSGSRQLRELHLGLMLGGDPHGKVYRAAVAVADRWCGPEPLCDGKGDSSGEECPLSELCREAQHGSPR